MSGKRPHDDVNYDGDAKRVRSNNGSPAPPQTDVERKKAEAMAKIAALRARMTAGRSNGAPATPAQAPLPRQAPASSAAPSPPPAANGMDEAAAKRAATMRKLEEAKARIAGITAARKGASGSPAAGGMGAPPPMQQQGPGSEMALRLAEQKEEARRRAAELANSRNRMPGESQAPPAPPPRQEGRGARGGLGIGLHPSLMGDLGAPSRAKSQQGPKFSTTKGNQQAVKVNPYLAASQEEQDTRFDEEIYDPTLASRKGGDRKTRELVFNQKGKFIAQANALKQQARIEEMKKRIAMETRKTEIEEAGDKAFLVQAPPDVEWWDEGLLPPDQNSYDDWENPSRNRISSDDTIITIYIQHPVLLKAPQEAFQPAAKPMMLTKTEQKKVRRQRRMADMKEEQAKIRLGLVEPPPPKVKKSNMMRVLGEQAVKDPTAVEARVNREIAQRQNDHEAANEDRKLTKEQRAEKLAQQQAADEAKGVKVCVFRVENLSSGKHRYKVDIGAKQNNLMGIVVLHPTMNLIIVEGGAHSIKAYKKLMLSRINWAENTLPLSATTPTTFTGPADGKESKQSSARDSWLNPMGEDGSLKDLSENRCQLVWEGEERAKSFKRWYSRVCETDGEAREVLRRSGMENMWTLARSLDGAV
jgi:U4/U6 small nuclear ribonucleoprotein PRP3